MIILLFNIIQPFKKLKYTFLKFPFEKIQLITGQNRRHCCLLFLNTFAKQCLSLCKICPCSIDFSASYVQVFPVHSYRACLKHLAQKQKNAVLCSMQQAPPRIACFALPVILPEHCQFPHLSRRCMCRSLVLEWFIMFLHIGHHNKGEDAHQH